MSVGPCAGTHRALVLALLVALPSGRSRAQDPSEAARPAPPAVAVAVADVAVADDGPSYPIDRFTIRYLHRGHPQLPKRDRVMRLEVELGETATGFVAPREGMPTVTLRLADIADRPVERYHASALQRVLERIYAFLAGRDLIGVHVAPDPEQIDATGADLRPEGRAALRILVTTAIVSEVRSVASGDRIAVAERVDHPLHAPLREKSPIQPFVDGDDERRDLLRKDLLDAYIRHLSRHPGRRVDAAIAPGDEPGSVTLDYLVQENNPLVLYAQISNTGTPSTDRVRERFGLIHTQLTNRDDVLSLDYATAAFDKVNALAGSYEFPLPFGIERLRGRVYGTWSEYTATELGFFNDVFTGESWSVGGEIRANLYQDHNLFVDLLAGWRFERIRVDNRNVGLIGEEDFHLANIGFRVEKQTQWYSATGLLTAEWNDGQDPPPDRVQLNRLGRLNPDTAFGVVRWDLAGAVYLEPLLDRAAWEDPSTPERSTLAHEVALSLSGQYAFDNRLVPQFQRVVGGATSVRGYPESIVAGDTVIGARLEYRYHLPRAFAIEPTPRTLFGAPFRAAPQHVYGRPDWDLVFSAFLDVAHSIVNDKQFFESDKTLVGAGVGVELQVRRNLNIRVDWGFALEELESESVNAGSNRLHVAASLTF